jgi:monoamine oxidase
LALDQALLTDWTADPWARGAYSAHGVEAGPEDQELLRQTVGRLHLAGEFLGGAFSGLMEGALRSGRRAADDVIAEQARGRAGAAR